MFNLQDLMQRYHPQFMQYGQSPSFGGFMQQQGQQQPGGYQPAQQMYASPAMAPQQPGGYQGGPQQWNPGGGLPSGGYSAGPAMRFQGQMPRFSLGSLMGRPNY